jgi:hypothetical protein
MILLARTKLELKHFAEFFTKLDSILFKLWASRFSELRAYKLASAIEELIICMPSGRDRSRFLNELRARWGHVLFADYDPPIDEMVRADQDPFSGEGS